MEFSTGPRRAVEIRTIITLYHPKETGDIILSKYGEFRSLQTLLEEMSAAKGTAMRVAEITDPDTDEVISYIVPQGVTDEDLNACWADGEPDHFSFAMAPVTATGRQTSVALW